MKFRRMLVITSALLAGCGAVTPTPATPQQPKADVPAKETPAAAPKAPAAEPEKKAAPSKEYQLVANGRFEEWSEALPKGWIGDASKVGKAKEAASGENAVELLVSDGYSLIEQAVVGVPKGQKVLVSAKIKASEAKDAAIKVVYYQGTEIKEVRKQYSGKGNWTVNAFEMTLPADASATGLRVQIIRNPEAKGTVLVDDVAVIVNPSTSAKPIAATPAATQGGEAAETKKEEAPAEKKSEAAAAEKKSDEAPAAKKSDAPAAKKSDAPATKK